MTSGEATYDPAARALHWLVARLAVIVVCASR